MPWLLVISWIAPTGCSRTGPPSEAPDDTPVSQDGVRHRSVRRALSAPDPRSPLFDQARSWQVSSTDPRSTTPQAPHWFANDDRGNVQRVDTIDGHTEHVLVDREGSGALIRLWSANPERGGTLRVTVDHQDQPVIEAPMAELLSGAGAIPPPLAEKTGGGFTLRAPITYGEHLRVAMDDNRGEGVYWVAQGLEWPGSVASTTPEDLAHLATVSEALQNRVERAPTDIGGTSSPISPVALDATVHAVHLRVSEPQHADGVWIIGTFDGTESLEVPVTGLCGTGPVSSEPSGRYADVWRTVTWGDDYRCSVFLPMPVVSTGALALEVRGSPVDVALQVETQSNPQPARFRLHGVHRDQSVPTRPRRDVRLLEHSGAGRLLSETVTIDNPVADWWGGGDEKIWVDGRLERGTGTEDHFGMAWCSDTVFSGPFGGQPRNDPHPADPEDGSSCGRSTGIATATRARVLDLLPWSEELRFDLGVRHRADVTIPYSSTVLFLEERGRER